MPRMAPDHILDEVLANRRLLTHPFYRRWEAGELHRSELASYAAQYRHVEAALPTLLEAVRDALAAGPARDAVERNLDDERGVPEPHLALFDDFALEVGAEPSPPTAATAALVGLYAGADRTDAGVALAVLSAYEVQAADIAVSKSEGLRSRYGISATGTRFWDVHGAMESEHAAWTLEALSALDVDEDTVRRSARRAADAWWAFLDERQEAAPALAG